MNQELKITLGQLKYLLDQQKEITTIQLMGQTYAYNPKSSDCSSFPIDVDKDKMMQVGMRSKYPNDYMVLEQYLK